jgi:hypothetical protein
MHCWLLVAFPSRPPANKQLQRTVIRHRGDAASAPFHYALASRITRQRAAAELRRYASGLTRTTL